MCLSVNLLNVKKIDKEFVGIGYKYIADYYLDSLRRLNPSCSGYRLKNWSKKWKQAKNNNLLEVDDKPYTYYPCGFHIFTKLQDAISYPIYFYGYIAKVEYKNIITVGFNHNNDTGICVVANNMRIKKISKLFTKRPVIDDFIGF